MASNRFIKAALLLVISVLTTGCLIRSWRPELRIEGPPADLASSAAPGPGLEVTFLGTSTLLIDDGEHALLIDGFFSRPRLDNVLFGSIAPNDQRIDTTLGQLPSDRIRAVLVAHSHFDHALDAGTIGRRLDAPVHGSASTIMLLQTEGILYPMAVPYEDGREIGIESFSVTPIETGHSLGNLALGRLQAPPALPMHARSYRADDSYSLIIRHSRGTILIVPAANFRPDRFRGITADVVFLSAGFLGRQPEPFFRRYWCETVLTTSASVVVPIHWDDLFVPLSEPLPPLPYAFDRVDLAVDSMRDTAARDSVRVVTLDAFQSIDASLIDPIARPEFNGCS